MAEGLGRAVIRGVWGGVGAGGRGLRGCCPHRWGVCVASGAEPPEERREVGVARGVEAAARGRNGWWGGCRRCCRSGFLEGGSCSAPWAPTHRSPWPSGFIGF